MDLNRVREWASGLTRGSEKQGVIDPKAYNPEVDRNLEDWKRRTRSGTALKVVQKGGTSALDTPYRRDIKKTLESPEEIANKCLSNLKRLAIMLGITVSHDLLEAIEKKVPGKIKPSIIAKVEQIFLHKARELPDDSTRSAIFRSMNNIFQSLKSLSFAADNPATDAIGGCRRAVFRVSDPGAPVPPPVGNIVVREDGRASFGASEGVKCGVFGNMLDTTAQNLITANSANFGRLSASARQAVNKINERGGHEGVVRILLVFIGITSSEYPNDVRNILREVGDDTMNRVDLEIAIGRSNNDMMSFNLFNEIFRGDSFDSFDLGAAWGFLVVHMGSHGIDNLTTTSYLAAFIDNNISVEEKRV